MTEKTIYKCDFCGLQFEDENSCSNHEKMHKDVERINDLIYYANSTYPSEVKIEMEDGKEFSYIRKEIY